MSICVLCDHEVDDGNFRFVEVIHRTDGVVQWVVCNWCAQLVKETFEQKD